MGSYIGRYFQRWWKPVKIDHIRKVCIGGDNSIQNCQLFSSNRVVTSEFTIWNFFPKTLFKQLTRLANFYFLLIGVIQLALKDSPTNPLTSFVPLFCVISLAIAKQGYEDWLRHVADNKINKQKVSVVKNGRLTNLFSEDIKIGDIVYVSNNHHFPCDMVLLCCDAPTGQCHIMTANLDGETSLKTRTSVEPYSSCRSVEDILLRKCVAEYENPVPYLYRFSGRLVLEHDSGTEIFPLGPDQLLPRGAELRNAAWAFGCAVYLGQDTKMSLNFQKKKTKISRLERTLNRYLLYYVLGLIAFNLLLVFVKYLFARPSEFLLFNFWGLALNNVNLGQMVDDYLSFIALTNYVVPISLYVTIEMMKMISAYFFRWDSQMYDSTRHLSAKANTSDLVENLGQIEHIFSDKTGTLTENCMQFRYCSAGGKLYRDAMNNICEVRSEFRKLTTGCPMKPFSNLGSDSDIAENGLDMCLLVLCLCHSARVECCKCNLIICPENVENCPHSYSEWSYLVSSPDELAFLEACSRYGVTFCGRASNSMLLDLQGVKRKFLIAAEIPWTATRQKMSVIVNDTISGKNYLLMKGADNAVTKCCYDSELGTETKHHLRLLAEDGYRVMACAMKAMEPHEAQSAQSLFRRANSCICFTEREQMFTDAAELFERDLKLIGATAVEDKLQTGVVETLQDFANCGIRRWVLTGDREETAVNVCRAAKLFTTKTQLLQLTNKKTISDCTAAIGEFFKSLTSCEKNAEFGIVFDGPTLALMLQVYSQHLLRLTTHPSVTAVLGCRLAPLQKAEIVSLVRNSASHPVCAAIGDGANDVSMILEADVGIAIFGSEGTSAARASDYAVPTFSNLRRAFFVHGYYFYTRLAVLVLYFFYKNLAFSAAQIYYVYFSLFSAQSLYESFHLAMYNVTFTSLPIFIYSIFEKPHSDTELLNDVTHYAKLRCNSYLSAGQFFFWNFTAIFHSVVIFYGCLFASYGPQIGHDISLMDDGTLIGHYAFGQMILTITLFVVLIKLVIHTRYWCWQQHAAFWFTVTNFFLQIYLYEDWLCSKSMGFLRFECDGSFLYIFKTPTFYFVAIVLITFALLPDLVCRVAFSISNQAIGSADGEGFSLSYPLQELCSPANSSHIVTSVEFVENRRPSSLISQNEGEWIDLLGSNNPSLINNSGESAPHQN